MLARLTVLSGAKTKHINLQLPTIIGRGGGSKIKLPASTVSRQHCEIYDYEGQIAIRDLGSSNGTVVNGHRIQVPTFVSVEDEVTIGPVKFRVATMDEVATLEPTELATTPPPTEDADKVSSFEELPPETSTPVPANVEQPAIQDDNQLAGGQSESLVPVFENAPSDDDGSVLQYAKPQDDGARSFVGIVPAEESPEPESDAPQLESEDAIPVAGDDSSLQNFFKNLDG